MSSTTPTRSTSGTPAPPSLWTRQFVLALSLSCVFAIGFNATVPLLPLYLSSFGAADGEIGLVVGVFGVAAFVFRPLSGQLVDRFGAKPVTVAGALAFAVATPLMGFTTAVPVLAALRLLQAAGLVCFWTASTVVGMSTSTPSRIGMASGFMGMTGPFGGLVASPLVVPLAGALGWSGVLLLTGSMGVVAAAMCLRVRLPNANRAGRPMRLRALVNRDAVTPTLFFVSWTLTQGPILAFAPLLAQERNLGNPGLFLAVLSLANTIIRPAAGVAIDRWGRPVVIVPALLLSAVTIALIGMSDTPEQFLLWGFMYGIANGMLYTALITLAIDRASVAERGSAIATFQWGWDMGMSASSAGFGLLTTMLGYGGIFVLSAIFPLAGTVVFTWAWRTRRLYIPVRALAIE